MRGWQMPASPIVLLFPWREKGDTHFFLKNKAFSRLTDAREFDIQCSKFGVGPVESGA